MLGFYLLGYLDLCLEGGFDSWGGVDPEIHYLAV